VRNLDHVARGSKAERLTNLSRGKLRAILQRAIVAVLDIIGIAGPRPPADQPQRGLNAGLGDCVTNGRNGEEKN
jgi:hypothetical protein